MDRRQHLRDYAYQQMKKDSRGFLGEAWLYVYEVMGNTTGSHALLKTRLLQAANSPLVMSAKRAIFLRAVDLFDGVERFEGEEEDDEEGPLSIARVTYSLLVSNVGWVQQENSDYGEVFNLYQQYVAMNRYAQVTLWASDEHDPIEETYLEEGE